MTEDTTFGFDDEALATRPTVYQPGLFDGQVVVVSGAGSGIGAGILGSLLVALFTGKIADLAEGIGQELFNAGILGLAAIMLAWHNIWMARHGSGP